MKRFNNSLKHVRVASPCNADWDQMIGDERIRFCGQCALHVYNLSGMSRREAEQLIEHNEGRLCVRYYKRTDGSVITKDCPIGFRAIRRRMSYIARAVASIVLSFLAGIGFSRLIGLREVQPPVFMGTMVAPLSGPTVMGDVAPITMGKIAYQPPPKKNRLEKAQ